MCIKNNLCISILEFKIEEAIYKLDFTYEFMYFYIRI